MTPALFSESEVPLRSLGHAPGLRQQTRRLWTLPKEAGQSLSRCAKHPLCLLFSFYYLSTMKWENRLADWLTVCLTNSNFSKCLWRYGKGLYIPAHEPCSGHEGETEDRLPFPGIQCKKQNSVPQSPELRSLFISFIKQVFVRSLLFTQWERSCEGYNRKI